MTQVSVRHQMLDQASAAEALCVLTGFLGVVASLVGFHVPCSWVASLLRLWSDWGRLQLRIYSLCQASHTCQLASTCAHEWLQGPSAAHRLQVLSKLLKCLLEYVCTCTWYAAQCCLSQQPSKESHRELQALYQAGQHRIPCAGWKYSGKHSDPSACDLTATLPCTCSCLCAGSCKEGLQELHLRAGRG